MSDTDQPQEVPAPKDVESTPVVAPVKAKGVTKLAQITAAANAVLKRYAETHTMTSDDDYRYPGLRELYKALNS